MHVVINQLWLSSPAPCSLHCLCRDGRYCNALLLLIAPPSLPALLTALLTRTALPGGVLRLCTEDKRQVAGQAGQARGYWSLRQPSLLSHTLTWCLVTSYHYTTRYTYLYYGLVL